MTSCDSRFDAAMVRLDALHAQDPRPVEAAGRAVPQELWYAERMSAWLERLVGHPDELTRLAVRAQHLQRWQIPRSDYAAGRVGYLAWRRDQSLRASQTAAAIMREVGYGGAEAEQVARMVRKQGLGREAGTQALEDCACLVFLENYIADFSQQVSRAHLILIVQKTWKKMSPRARELALALPMNAEVRAVVGEGLADT